MDGYSAATYGDHFADVYDDWYDDISNAEATADAIASLVSSRPGTVVELGIGTGRIAIPLAERGLDVIGIDASPAMLDRLRAKPGTDGITLHLADLAAMDGVVVPPVDLALLAFNTLFNLTTAEAQTACLRTCAGWLAPGGAVVIEALVPADDLASNTRRLEPTRIAVDEVVLTVSEVAPDGHLVFGQHIHVRESGIRLRPWQLRMLTPDAIDALAAQAELVLTDRWRDWGGAAFSDVADRHVSVYRRVNDPGPTQR